jgi:plasmid stabilization system protein ParE
MTLVIVPDAIQDLDEIYDYIERNRPQAAEQVLNRLVTTF